MDPFSLLIGFLVALLLLRYALRWGHWVAWRSNILYPSVPVWWSVYVCAWVVTGLLFENFLLLTAIASAVVLPLLLPPLHPSKRNDSYAYLDAYEHLRKARRWIFGILLAPRCLTLLWVLWEFPTDSAWFLGLYMGLEMVPLLLAGCTDHKGLMLLWAILGLLGLVYRYAHLLFFTSIPMGL